MCCTLYIICHSQIRSDVHAYVEEPNLAENQQDELLYTTQKVRNQPKLEVNIGLMEPYLVEN